MPRVLRVLCKPLGHEFPAQFSGSQVVPIIRRVDLRVQVVGQLVEEGHVDLVDEVDGGWGFFFTFTFTFTFPL